ncbi:MAG: 4Fe-4S binding protein [Dehalococcoidia bacterium]
MSQANQRRSIEPSIESVDATPLVDYSQGYIISSDCMDCGVCEYMCPQSAIYEAKRQFVIKKQLCNGCGDCVPYCPARAIVLRSGFHDRQDRTVRNVLGAVLSES